MAEQFHAQQLAMAKAATALPFLAELKEQGLEAFSQASMPTRKTEAWRFTPLFKFVGNEYVQAQNNELNEELAAVANIEDLNAARLVFVNGVLNTELSDALALEQVTLFSQANAEQQTLIKNNLGSVLAQAHGTSHLFNDLNNASTTEGVLIHVAKNQQLTQPIQVSYLTTDNKVAFSVNTRTLMIVETGAQATLVEQYASDSTAQVSFTNAMTEIRVDDNAQIQHYRLVTIQEEAQHIGGTHVELNRDSQYNAFHLSLGSKLSRNDLVVNHNVGGSHSEISGVYVPQHDDLVDFHTCIEHRAAHCTGNEVFRGIINDKARAVFNGRIHIHPDAQKTHSELSNKNLLLTNSAEIYTKPELEIYADDVKCAHGATVSQLDEQASFYLQSRGISKQEANVILSFGFINELLQALPHKAITHLLRPVLARRFGRDTDELSSHLLDKDLL